MNTATIDAPTDAATTIVAVRALSDLVDYARDRARTEHNMRHELRARAYLEAATTLDRARTRLVQDGTEYLDAAWAFVDAGRRHMAAIGGSQAVLDRIAGKVTGP